MAQTANPRINMSLSPAAVTQSIAGRNDLIVGTKPASGTATAGALYKDVFSSYTKAQLDSLFGSNSDLRNRLEQIKRANGGYTQVDVIAVDQGVSATAAQGKIIFLGTATADGAMKISLVDEFQYSYTFEVVSGDTAAELTTTVATQFSETNYPFMPVSVSEVAGEVIIDSIDLGTTGNDYIIKVEDVPDGITVAVTNMNGGTVDPTVTTIFDNLEAYRVWGINWPTAWISQINVMKDFLDERFNSDNAILDGRGFTGSVDTFANNKALVDALNSENIVIMGNTTALSKPPSWTAAFFQGVRSLRLTDDQDISEFIPTTTGILDKVGGQALASLPYHNTPLVIDPVVEADLLYSDSEQKELAAAGFTVIGVYNNNMIMGTVVTTSTEDSAGNPNESFLYLNNVDTGSVCREYFFNNFKARYVQSRLTEGRQIIGRSIENINSIQNYTKGLFINLGNDTLVQAGSDAEEYFVDNLSISLDLQSGTVDLSGLLPIIIGLRTINFPLQLSFTTGGE